MRHRWRSDGVGNRRLEGSFDQSAPRTLNKNHFWRRREGVEPSGDLTAPRLVLKTSGTTGHLPSPRDKNQLANTSANSGKDTAEHAMVNSLHRIAMIRGNEKDPRPTAAACFGNGVWTGACANGLNRGPCRSIARTQNRVDLS